MGRPRFNASPAAMEATMSPHSQRSAAISAAFLAGALAAAVPSASSAAEYSGYVDLGVEQQKTDWLMLIEPGFSMRSEMFDLNIAVPLRFDLSDSFNIWKKDWDHLSDAGRVLRNASLRMNDDAFRMKLGVLTHTSFGHGTMVQGFISSLDPDTMPMGASLFVQTGAVTVEAMASDIFGPEVFGGSVAVEPITLTGTNYDRLHLIASFVADPSSPGEWHEDGTHDGSEWVFMYGFGIDWAVIRTDKWQLAPYFDANINGRGYGFHLGLTADFLLDPVKLSFRGEWRWAKAPYAPDYFDLAYTIERKDWSPSTSLPVSQALALDEFNLHHSGKLEVRAESGPVSATAVFAGIGQGLFNSSIVVNAHVKDFELSLFGALRHFKFGHNPDRSMALGELRYRFQEYFYTWLTVGQLYRFNSDHRATPLFLWSTGVGAAFLLQRQTPRKSVAASIDSSGKAAGGS